MHNHRLLETIKTTLQKSKVEQLAAIASDETFSVSDLIDLSFYQDEQVAFRAAWIMENVYTLYPLRFLPYIEYFLSKFSVQVNLSALRLYVKIMALMTGRKATEEVRDIINKYETEIIVERVFGWLIDEKIPVAIKSYCLNILANLIPKHEWVKDELILTMEFLVDQESIAFFAKVKQIRKQLAQLSRA